MIMATTTTRALAARCIHCGETDLTEWCPVLRRWLCLVCAKTWRPPDG